MKKTRKFRLPTIMAVLAMFIPGISHAQKLEVGNYCASSPYGMTMLIDRGAAVVLAPPVEAASTWCYPKGPDEALLPYADCSADGSFTKATTTYQGHHYRIRFGKTSDVSVAMELSADSDLTVPLRLRQPFDACRTQVKSLGKDVLVYAVAGNTGKVTPVRLTCTATWQHAANYQPEADLQVAIKAHKPTLIIATLEGHEAPSPQQAQNVLDQAERKYYANKPESEGAWGDFAGAIAKTLRGSRVFSSHDRTIAHTIGRGWWMGHHAQGFSSDDLMPLFTWDSFFNAAMASLDDTATAHATVRALLSYQLPSGMVPNYARWPCDGFYITPQKTNPPVGAMCVWKMHERQPSLSFLAEVYPALLRWHDWFRIGRGRPGEWLLSWGNDGGDAWQANLESGWDDTPVFEGAKIENGLLNIYTVDLSSLWAADAEYLAKMADALGYTKDAQRLRAEYQATIKEINDKLWNEELGAYCNRFVKDAEDGSPRFLTRLSPMNFYPLICGAPDAKRAKRVLKMVHDPKKFWGEWPMPTLPYDDPLWPKQTYWKGHVWGPCSYLVWQGLRRYDDDKHLATYIKRSVELFMRGWNGPLQATAENYNSTDGTVGDDPHYTWGALLPLMGVEYLAPADGTPAPNRRTALKESVSMKRIPIHGKLYNVQVANGKITTTIGQ